MSRTIQSLPQTPANKIYCIIIATNGIPEEDYDISLWKSLKSNNIQSCISVCIEDTGTSTMCYTNTYTHHKLS